MTAPALVTPRAVDARVGNLRMRYYLWDGHGPTVVMLHPWRGYGRMWDLVVPYLAPDVRVIAPDQRGHGDTARPPHGYAAEDFAQDLTHLLDRLALERVMLVGHSLGARTAQIVAGRHPERVARLALVGGPHPESLATTAEQIADNRRQVEAQRRMPQRFDDERAARAYIGELWPGLTTPQQRDHVLEFNTRRERGGGVAFKFDCQRVADGLSHVPEDLSRYVRTITSPVLLIRPTRGVDPLAPETPAKLAGYFEKTRVTTVLVDGVDCLPLENPKAVGEALREFFLTP